jgi:hypothetical protein
MLQVEEQNYVVVYGTKNGTDNSKYLPRLLQKLLRRWRKNAIPVLNGILVRIINNKQKFLTSLSNVLSNLY